MKQKIKYFGAALLMMCCLSGCGSGITQEDYDAVVAEKDELQQKYDSLVDEYSSYKAEDKEKDENKAETERLIKAREVLSVTDNLVFSESEEDGYKALIITMYLRTDADVLGDSENLGRAIAEASKENWFDYDYIFIEGWNGEPGLITSIITDVKNDLSMKSYQWLTDENTEATTETPENEKSEIDKETNSSGNVTMGQKNALKKAKQYLDYSAFSYEGLKKQLEYEEFSKDEVQYAVDNCGADWNEQAVKKAAQYLEYSSFSRNKLIEQLEYEGFTHDQAVYGVEQNGY